MNKKQYNNIINWTLEHEKVEHADDSVSVARAIFTNMGVALPQGDCAAIAETLKSNDYMGWRECNAAEAQIAANNGVASIALTDDDLIVILAESEEINEGSDQVARKSLEANSSQSIKYYSYTNITTNYDDVTGLDISDIPIMFRVLVWNGYATISQFKKTFDGFVICTKPLSQIMYSAGVGVLFDSNDNYYFPGLYYDDWYAYSIYEGNSSVYGLLKMREQESDTAGDNNDPGVTISFILVTAI